ncbi:MAG TPA: hypothetical protein PLS03_01775 [Terrimicrobiaceae bacterium]|nr:hypothetical protein [Terrimicrobiaceae bacterium]
MTRQSATNLDELAAGQLRLGKWSTDEAGLPCFDGAFDHPDTTQWPFPCGLSTGRLLAHVNRWGALHLFTTEGGYRDLSANRGAVYSGIHAAIEIDGQRHSLVFDALSAPREVRYGVGYVRFNGRIQLAGGRSLAVTQVVAATPDNAPGLLCRFHLRNLSDAPVEGILTLGSDMDAVRESNHPERTVHVGPGFSMTPDACPDLGCALLLGPEWISGVARRGVSLRLSGPLTIAPGDECVIPCFVGISGSFTPANLPLERLSLGLPQVQEAWSRKLENVRFDDACFPGWMIEEARWCYGQLLSFLSYDCFTGETFPALGGYGWRRFGVREIAETAIALVEFDRELALQSLRMLAKLQRPNGDIPHAHDYTPPKEGEVEHKESDTEIWFLMACGEVAAALGDDTFLDEMVTFRDGSGGSLFEHGRRAFAWILDGIGMGSHGLVHIAQGDWNDYLSRVGVRGFGESVMNSGMACRAFAAFLPSARSRDPDFAAAIEQSLAGLRTAVSAAFDNGWFLLGYDDDGNPLATRAEDRLYLNSQAWAALGGCGTPDQRRRALSAMLAKCGTRIGLSLLSRPYPCPPPKNLSLWPIPPGEGENGGIWPQTVHWAIWALSEEGMIDEALQEWRSVSLRNHALCFPHVPFGIFNGPDCFSSHHSAGREGWSQIQMIQRAIHPPMNPAVAWQAFSLKKIEAAVRKADGRE